MKFASLVASALLTAFWSFTALSLAMDRHHEDSYGRGTSPGTRRRRLQLAGCVGLALSLAACLALQGPAQGWVLWLGVLTAGALALVPLHTYAPAQVPRLGLLAAGAALLAAALALATG